MKASELIELLKDVPPDTEVMLSIDAEGNGYHHCRHAELSRWSERNDHMGIVELNDTLRKAGYCEEDVPANSEVVVCLWP